MKTRIVRDRRAGALTLSVRPQKGEVLDYALAEWLRGSSDAFLLDFSYSLDARDPELYFDMTATEELPRYLKRTKLASSQFQDMICAVRNVLALCTERTIATSYVRFDAAFVRVDEAGALRFALVPLSGVPAASDNTPTALLRVLAERAHFVVEDDARRAAALLDFVRRNVVLSLSALGTFLKEQYGGAGATACGSSASGSLRGSGGLRWEASMSTSDDRVPAPGQSREVLSAAALDRLVGDSGCERMRSTVASTCGSAHAAFDPVSMLMNAPSAAEVRAMQGTSDRVRSGISESSPTARRGIEFGRSADVHEKFEEQSASLCGSPEDAHVDETERRCLTSGSPRAESVVAAAEEGAPAAAVCAPALEDSAPASPEPLMRGSAAPVGGSGPNSSSVAMGGGAEELPASPASRFADEGSRIGQPEPTSRQTPRSAVGSATSGGTTLLAAPRTASPQSVRRVLERLRDGRRFPLPACDDLVLGRSMTCDVSIDGNSNISRRHASIVFDGRSACLVDIGSANGTFIDGGRLAPGTRAMLVPGMRIALADEVFTYQEE